jgi:8-oxo-dGTP diphosphatase
MADGMDVVRALFRALNDEDAEAAAALYHAECLAEQVFRGEREFCAGRELVRAAWLEEFATRAGRLPGGHRFDVSGIAGIETGWGWVRAEWVSVTADRAGGAERGSAGYSYFWVEDGLIRRHRSIARELPAGAVRQPRPPSERRYPSRPLIGVGAVVFDDSGRVLLVKRKHEPLAGQWSLPGGMLELGESLEAGVVREIAEETGLHVTAGPVVDVFDRILLDDTGKVRFHFVLVDYVCRVRGGTLRAGSDVSDVAWTEPAALHDYHMAEKPKAVIAKALQFHT